MDRPRSIPAFSEATLDRAQSNQAFRVGPVTPTRLVAWIFGTAAVYYICGWLGLLLAIPPGYATAVWPSSGVALAIVLLLGYRVLPGVMLGSFLVNVGTSLDVNSAASVFHSLILATSIGCGAGMQAALGRFLICRYVGFPTELTRERQIIFFFLLGGPVACAVSALWGAGSLVAGHVIAPSSYLFSCWTWWVGDTIGVMIFCPLILLFTAQPAHAWRPRRLVVGAPLCVMFALAVVLFAYARRWEHNRQRADFDFEVDTLSEAVQRQLIADLDALRSLQALFSVAGNVDREQFRRFVADPLDRHPGIALMAWLPRIPADGRGDWERNIHAAGFTTSRITDLAPGLKLVPAASRDEYFPITYVEPSTGRSSVVGFDTTSEPRRRQAMLRARDTGEPAATGPIIVVRDGGGSYGVLLSMAVYKPGTVNTDARQRRANLIGYVTTAFRTDSLMETALRNLDQQGVDLYLIDNDVEPAMRVMYSHNLTNQKLVQIGNAGIQSLVNFDFAGRKWTLRAVRSNEYLLAHPSLDAWVVLAGGLLFTSLLGGFLMVLTGRTTRIEVEVKRRTAELDAMSSQLRFARDSADAANRAKSLFLANMSHEIRTPLTAVIGFSDLLLEPDRQTLNREECLTTIRGNARHLLGLINEVLDISKIEAGHLKIEPSRVDLCALVKEAVQMTQPQAVARQLEFRVECQPPIPCEVETDPLRLRQVLLNLITNALKFTDQGGVYVKVSAQPWEQAYGRKRFALRFDVRDTGIGLTPAQIGSLFRTFSQADPSTTRRFGGTGLGLALSQQLACLMDGSITVESAPGVGSTFTLTIHAFAPDDVRMIEQPPDMNLPVTDFSLELGKAGTLQLHGRILLAEDGKDNARYLSTVLGEAGADVTVVNNGRRAVDLIFSDRFDLVLMDMQMPVLDGYGATAEARSRGCTIPILALTAEALEPERARAIAAGVNEYLLKPIETEVLITSVAKYLSQGGRTLTNGDAARHRSTLAGSPKWKKLVDQYISELPADVAELETMLHSRQIPQLAAALHRIKGTGTNYGFPAITQLAAVAETKLKPGSLDIAESAIIELLDYMRGIEGYACQSMPIGVSEDSQAIAEDGRPRIEPPLSTTIPK